MDFDLFFSTPRWKILEILAKEPSSPVEISQKINTSVAYVSQQLKLLEAANLIVKKRTGSVEKGKPRTLFSLSNEILQLTVLMNKNPARKIVYINDYHKLVLRIWLLENPELHYYVEKLYWKIEEDLENVEGIFVDSLQTRPKIIIVSNSKKLQPIVNSFLKNSKDKVDCSIVSDSDFRKSPQENIHSIYDPKFLLLEKEVKGGNKEK